jgi:circadian clock protein KaiC
MPSKTDKPSAATNPPSLTKAPTGIEGLDEISGGGLPAGRPTLVCGAAGCGKTMLAAEFLVNGATKFGEPGVFMMFEESADELAENMRSLGFDLRKLQKSKRIAVDSVRVDRSGMQETGEFELDGLFMRLGAAIDSVKAKRVVLDTIEALFAGIANHAIVRSELRRLFGWLKDRGVTAVITAERGSATLTRYGLEEYVADCVILLDHRVTEQVSTRRLRIVKYRGSRHGTNEYPFLIGDKGISVLPITSLSLNHEASSKRMPTGIAGLDDMLGGKGPYRGSSILVSGAPGTGKSSLSASFADAACRRGERVVIFAYEESESQVLRNMKSIGLDLGQWVDKGLLRIESTRPTLHGLEQHLVMMYGLVGSFKPAVVIVDPISNLTASRDAGLTLTLMRLIDFLKTKVVTGMFTSLTAEGDGTLSPVSEVGVSSLMDTWLLLSNVATNGERTRTLQVLKSRGMNHSNKVREFVFSDEGLDLVDVYMSGERVLTGAARVENSRRGTPSGGSRAPGDRGHSLADQIAALIVSHAEASGLPVRGNGDASSLGALAAKRAASRRRTTPEPGARTGSGRRG